MEKNRKKMRISRVGHLSRMTTEASSAHLLGHEAIPKGQGTTESLNFERSVNSYSIATRRAQLAHLGLLDEEDSFAAHRDEYFQARLSMRKELHLPLKKKTVHAPTGKQWTRWILTVSAGLLCGLVAIFILFCVQKIGEVRGRHINQHLQWAKGREGRLVRAFFEYTAINLSLALSSCAICLWFAPLAVGSGLPEVKAYLNGVCVPRFAKFNVFLAKIFATILSVTSGLIVGPEGPLVHIGAIIGQGITKTAGIERFVRQLQVKRPLVSGILGCARINVFGKGEHASGSYNAVNSNHDGEDTSLLRRPRSGNHESEEKSTTCCSHSTIFSQLLSHLSKFRNDHERRDLISIAVACGFACAFGAPVGGLLYSMEEASSYLSVRIMWRTLVATALGTLMISVYYGSLDRYSVLSLGVDLLTSDDQEVLFTARFLEIPLYVLCGAASGLLGAFFNANYEYTNKRRKAFYGDPRMSRSRFLRYKLLEVAAVSLLTSTLTFVLPVTLPWACTRSNEKVGSEKDAILESSEEINSIQFNCPTGMVNEIGSILLGSRDDAMNDILTDPTIFEARTLLTCGLTFYFLMLITFGIDMPSGMFMPTLITGSTLGGWAGIMIQRYILPTVAPATFAMLMATGLLAGIQRTTVSLVVIMMEATGKIKVLIPLIVTVIVARYVGDVFNDGIYHIGMHLKGYPYRDLYVKSGYDIANVTCIMTRPVVTLHEIEKVSRLVRILKETTHNGFPVVDKSGTFVGLIRRDQIVALIECGVYTEESNAASPSRDLSFDSCTDEEDADLSSYEDDAPSGNSRETASHRRNDSVDVSLQPENEWYKDSVLKPNVGGILLGTAETLPVGVIRRRTRTRVHVGQQGCLVVDAPREEVSNHVDIAAAMNCGARSVMERCPVSQAYVLFASCGLRHLTVLGQGGRVTGIVTRKNLDPEFLEEMIGIGGHN